MSQAKSSIVYLKLGGSLITDKRRPETPRLGVIEQLAADIAEARRLRPSLQLVIGHGSGSFGHVAGQRYGTRDGVQNAEEWHGFAVTADAAARLNRIVTAALLAAGIPAWTIQPSVDLRCQDGVVVAGPEATVLSALTCGLVPVVHGDVALDGKRGGTIASTEEIFEWLAHHLPPSRLILLGEVDGIYDADPALDPTATRVRSITPETLAVVEAGLGHSHGVDVTGGMASKVAQSMQMVDRHQGLEIVVCSGLIPGNLRRTLIDPSMEIGTRIAASNDARDRSQTDSVANATLGG